MTAESTMAISSKGPWTKWIVFLFVAAFVVGGYVYFRDSLSLSSLAARESEFRQFRDKRPIMVYSVAFIVYVAVTGLSLPGAAGLTLVCGWLFGFWRGVLLVSFASTAGATVAFIVSRFLLRDAIQKRFGDRLRAFNDALNREGAFYLFMLRLIPAVPFFVINVVMGLTPLSVRTYWWVSQAGMLPGTAAYVYAGASVPDLATLGDRGAAGILSPQLLIAFVLLGLMPIAMKRIVAWTRPTSLKIAAVGPHPPGVLEEAKTMRAHDLYGQRNASRSE